MIKFYLNYHVQQIDAQATLEIPFQFLNQAILSVAQRSGQLAVQLNPFIMARIPIQEPCEGSKTFARLR